MTVKKADIHFRIPESEREVIETTAAAMGKSLSEYARDVLLAASEYEKNTYAQEKKFESEKATNLTHNISVRCSQEEWRYYKEQSDMAGCSVSKYIRMCANGKSIVVVPGLKELVKQIAKLGVNVNQLTMLAHQGKIKEVDLFATNDILKQVLKELRRMARNKG